jgi:3-hydroxybutyryl-CoA dehydrogenase
MGLAQPLRVGIVGGGLMGTGIAETVARAGHDVALYEPIADARVRSQQRITASSERALAAGKLDAAAQQALLARIRYVEELAEFGDRELVIEAVVEDLEVKLDLFRRLDRDAAADALLASNTSSIPIAELASAVRAPERVLGLHFFSPVPVMRLVEVVCALETSEQTAATAMRFVESLGKTAVVTKDRSGFVVNMLLIPYLVAAVRMLEEGFATREDIDSGMTLGCGHPMGPLALCDYIGLDVVCAVCDSLFDEFKKAEYAAPPLLRRMLSAGRLGRKSGRGFYAYDGSDAASSRSRSAARN